MNSPKKRASLCHVSRKTLQVQMPVNLLFCVSSVKCWRLANGTCHSTCRSHLYASACATSHRVCCLCNFSSIYKGSPLMSVLTRMTRRLSFRLPSAPGWCLAYNLNDLHFTLTYFGTVKEHWQYSLPGRIQPALATLEAIAEDRLQLEADAIKRHEEMSQYADTHDERHDEPDFTDLFPTL